MIQMTMTMAGHRIRLLGLDRQNLQHLMAGKPLRAEGSLVGFDDDIILLFGEGYEDVLEELRKAGVPIPEKVALPGPDETLIIKGEL